MEEEIKLWWKQSLEDIDTAKINLKAKKYYVTVLFSQQAIEKGLKGLWLKEKKEKIPFVHDLTFLSKKLNIPQEFSTLCKELTTAYSETRYPDSNNIIPSKKFSKEDAEEYLKKSEDLVKWIRKKIL